MVGIVPDAVPHGIVQAHGFIHRVAAGAERLLGKSPNLRMIAVNDFGRLKILVQSVHFATISSLSDLQNGDSHRWPLGNIGGCHLFINPHLVGILLCGFAFPFSDEPSESIKIYLSRILAGTKSRNEVSTSLGEYCASIKMNGRVTLVTRNGQWMKLPGMKTSEGLLTMCFSISAP